MHIDKNQSESIAYGIQFVIGQMRAQTLSTTLSSDIMNALNRDIEKLDEIHKFIENKEFSIVLNE